VSAAHIARTMTTALLLAASTLRAQGTIASQGFGYPTGQLTSRAAATGGTLSEFDNTGTQNPAALMYWGVAGAYLQYSPERRSTKVGTATVSTTIPLFPVFAIGLPAGQKYSFGVSSSTLLERNFDATIVARQLIRTDSVTVTSVATARGAMSDIQFGAAMQVKTWLRAGAAIHLITGSNRFNVTRDITPDTTARADSATYDRIQENSTATFSGRALSFGIEITPTKKFNVAASTRLGFGLKAELSDSSRQKADVPNRAGIAARYDLAGTTLAVRYNWEGWSAMRGLGAQSGGVFDSKEFGVGAEVPGPRIRGSQILLRVGARSRDLPFGIGGRQPTERVFGGGLGMPLAFGRAQIDLGVERAARKVPGLSNVSERGLTMSVGFRLRT
jgi:hypothetical protein